MDGSGAIHRILVVDDDDDVRNGLARALSLHPRLELCTASDGFEAGYQFASFRPHLVLLDVVMPGMGGFDICERLRRFSGEGSVKVIILTGFPGHGSNEQSIVAGADLYLTKPQDVNTLLTHIEDLLGD